MNANIDSPILSHEDVVQPAWIDYNNHMNMGYYVVVFDIATDGFFKYLHLTREFKQEHNVTTFSLEAHVTYNREVKLGDPLIFKSRLLNYDAKRIHFFHEMYHGTEGYLAATNELISIHISLETRRSAPIADVIQQRLAAILKAHNKLPRPPQVGRVIGVGAKPA